MASTKRAWKLQEFVAHGSNVNCLALGHKSGRVMVTGGDDKKVNMWAVGKPNCILSLSGHTSPVEAVRFGNAEEMVVAGSLSGALKIWDLEAAKIVRTLTGHKANIRSLDFHPYGDFVASGSRDTNIKLWDIRRKGCIFTYKGHSNTVNCLRFSPDGRWISSAGEDGILKIWDLAAGKLLHDFKNHDGPVTAIEFHPNEFLMASGSADRTVKYWDLESFQMVSSTDGDSTGIRSILFHPEGHCLYSGATDILKVYGWEPAQCYDSLPMGWGKVMDIGVAQNQLIGATFSQTNVSTFVVDITRVQPIGGVANVSPALSSGGGSRRSYVAERPPTQSTRQVPKEEPPEDPSGSDDKDEENAAEIRNPDDYRDVFQARKRLDRSPTRQPEPFPAPPDDGMPAPVSAKPTTPPASKPAAVNSRPTSTASKPSSANSKPSSANSKPSSANSKPSSANSKPSSANSRTNRLNSPARGQAKPERDPPAISSATHRVDPPKSPPKAAPKSSRPEPKKNEGLNPEDFLPKQAMGAISRGDVSSNVPEPEALSSIMKGHDSMAAVLNSRSKNLQIVRALWTGGNTKTALDSAIGMNDQAIMLDLLNVLIMKPALWNLDMCSTLTPQLSSLVTSKYENYVTTSLSALRLILKNFATVIKSNIVTPPGGGVDISREERYHKCKALYRHLMDIRTDLRNKQHSPSQAPLVREVNLLMSQLD